MNKLFFWIICAVTSTVSAEIIETSNWKISRSAKQRQYSQNIFGMADARQQTFTLDIPTVNRWGGNTTSRYNWKLGNAWNTGKDWFFENIDVGENRWQKFLKTSFDNNATVIITVPMIGYVAKDTKSSGFSVRKYGNQQQTDQWRPDAGNGIKPDGSYVKNTSPFDTSIPAGANFAAEWAMKIAQMYPQKIKEGKIIFAMDNEPMLWHETHRDIHPLPVGYAEYIAKFKATALAIKKAVPEALIAGPDVWGWTAYTQSAKDSESHYSKDKRQFGDSFIPWLLKQMQRHEQSTGQRLLDYLTVHYYPQAQDVFSDNSSLTVAMDRIMAPRSLYDAGYKDPSWINTEIMLIPRIKQWIEKYYPGTKFGITEYNWGAEDDISGAIALADSLGIFAEQGVDIACYWTWPHPNTKAEIAFRLFTNVDTNGTSFPNKLLDTKLMSMNKYLTSVYAAENSSRISVIAINKSESKTNFSFLFNNIAITTNIVYYIDHNSNSIKLAPEACRKTGAKYNLKVNGRSIYHIIFNKSKSEN